MLKREIRLLHVLNPKNKENMSKIKTYKNHLRTTKKIRKEQVHYLKKVKLVLDNDKNL